MAHYSSLTLIGLSVTNAFASTFVPQPLRCSVTLMHVMSGDPSMRIPPDGVVESFDLKVDEEKSLMFAINETSPQSGQFTVSQLGSKSNHAFSVQFSKKDEAGQKLPSGIYGVSIANAKGEVLSWRAASTDFGLNAPILLPNSTIQGDVILTCLNR